jgi:hypothetical protein
MELTAQVIWLLVLAVPVASVSWTVTHEEIFREAREFLMERSRRAGTLVGRKFHYLFTCEYCFSHSVALAFVALTGFSALLPGWRGYLISWLALVWVANVYMSLYGRLRLDIRERNHTREREQGRLSDHTDATHPGNH